MRFLLSVVCLLVVGCGSAVVPTTTLPSAITPTITPAHVAGRALSGVALTPCVIKGEVPVRAQADALCGVLQVPEDRSKPSDRQIGLRVAVVPATRSAPAADPLFVLTGGPGDVATRSGAQLPAQLVEADSARRA